MKGPDGKWNGLTVELWNDVAGHLGFQTRFVERPSDMILGEIVAGSLDTSAGPFASTMERQNLLDFTHDYLSTGVGVAVLTKSENRRWLKILEALTAPASLQIYLAFGSLMLGAGIAIWLIERRRNPMFGGRPIEGMGSGYWWAGVTTFGVGYGDKVPVTFWGRFVALIWMLISVMLLASLTAFVAARLSVVELGQFRGPSSLRNTIVAGVAGAAATEWLRTEDIPHRLYPNPVDALAALRRGEVEAVVYGRATLRYYATRDPVKDFEVLPIVLNSQTYAFPVRNGSPLRDPINEQLRLVLAESRWKDLLDRYLGDASLMSGGR